MTCEIYGAAAYYPHAQENGDQLAIGEGSGSEGGELFARALGFGEFLDARGCAILARHAYKSSFLTGATTLPGASPLEGSIVSFV